MKQAIKFSAVAAFILLSSCNRHEQQPVNIICLVDFSPSRDSAVIEWYKETIKRYVIDHMGKKDRVIVLPIDFNSATASKEIFAVDFSKNDYSNEFAGLQKDEIEKQNHEDSITAAGQHFDTSFEQTKVERQHLPMQGTDIFGALKQCRKYYRAGCKNVVIIFSDMIQYSDRNDMNFEEHLNREWEVGHYVRSADKADLTDMNIIVLTGAQITITPQKYKVVQTFWEKYIAECNGRLIDYSSGAASRMDMVFATQTDAK